MIEYIFFALRRAVYLLELKRGYQFDGWKESTNIGITLKFKEYRELRAGFMDEFYKKNRFGKRPEVHKWSDRHGFFIGYRSNATSEI